MKNLLFLFLVLILLSCFSSNKNSALVEAENIMDSLPDSALSILNNCKMEVGSYDKSNKMKFLLLYTEAQNKTFIPMDTVSYMPEVLSYYKKHGNADELMTANYITGCVFRDKGDSPRALRYFLDAVNNPGISNDIKYFKKAARIYGQIGLLFERQRMPQRALQAWSACRNYALKGEDTLTAIQAREYSGYAYSLMNKEDSVINIAREVYVDYKEIGREDYASSSLSMLIEYYINKDSLPKAKSLISEYISCSGLVDKEGTVLPGHEMFYHLLGKLYEKENKQDSAIFCYSKLISSAVSLNSKENGYRGMLSVYVKDGNADSIAKYAILFANTNDSANILHSANEINKVQALYDYSESQELSNKKIIENNRLRYTTICLILLFIILFLAVYYYHKRQKDEKQKEIRVLNQKYSDTIQLYTKAVEDRKRLELGVEKAKIEKDKEISMLKEALNAFSEYTNEKDWNAEHVIMGTDIITRLHDHANKAKTASASEWTDLGNLVEELMPEFYSFIVKPEYSLTDREIRLCILTRLHFLTSEITTLLGIKKQGTTNLRANVNKKLFNEKGTKTFTTNIYGI